jgi:hypothetical protein
MHDQNLDDIYSAQITYDLLVFIQKKKSNVTYIPEIMLYLT